MEHRWAVETSSGIFLYGGVEPYDVEPGLSPSQARIVLDRAPNPRTERYSGTPGDPFRAATGPEMTAFDAAIQDTQAANDIDEKKLKAITLGLYENWANPLMTKAQLRNRILAIYKAL